MVRIKCHLHGEDNTSMKLQIMWYFTSFLSAFDSWSWHLTQRGVFNAFQLQEDNNQNFARWWANVKADRQLGDLRCLLAQRTILIWNIYFQALLNPFILFICKITFSFFFSKSVFPLSSSSPSSNNLPVSASLPFWVASLKSKNTCLRRQSVYRRSSTTI